MPKSLLDRNQPDSIREFREAAKQRAADAHALHQANRRTAAIYFWGYAAEMTLKAGYFALIGFTESQRITVADLHAARLSAPRLGVAPFANLHDIRGWAELLIATRASLPGFAYPIPNFANQVALAGRQIYSLWRESLRYHKNVAYEYEMVRVRSAAHWLLANIRHL
ncbi:MAG: hypothetical protein KDA47_19235 [Planctomycetales bacterium]|nr:hypothetical protein [Planctomycetales bacterium]